MNIINNRLPEYINNNIGLTSVLNKFLYSGDFDGYELLGSFIKSKLEVLDNLTPQLKFYLKDTHDLDTLAIYFIAGMESDMLQKMFGEPIYHNDFGEGFEGEYDEVTKEYSEPLRKESYASYMLEINGYIFHIGYDHRGTRIEVQSDIDPKMLLECLKEVTDLYLNNI